MKLATKLKQRAMDLLGIGMVKPDDKTWVRSNLRTAELSRGRFMPKDGAAYIPYLRGWVDMCAKKNATNCAMSEMMHFRIGGNGRKVGKQRTRRLTIAKGLSDRTGNMVEVENSTALDMLRNPSSQESGEDFKLTRFYAKEACGNAFVYLSDSGELMTLRPQFVAPIFQDAEQPIAGWVYGRGREREVALPFDSVVQFKHLSNIDSPWLGDGPTKVCAEYADLLMFSTVAEAARWRNGNPPPYAVILPETITDPTKRAQAIAEVERQLNGPENAGNRIVLAAADIKNLGFPPKDMEYVEGTRESARMILGAFDIPELLYFSTESGLATIEIALKHYYKTAIWPRLKRDAKQMTAMMQKIGVLGVNEFLAYENPSEEDNQAEATYWKTVCDAGLATADTACEDMGLPLLPGGVGNVPRYNGQIMTDEKEPEPEPVAIEPDDKPVKEPKKSYKLTDKVIKKDRAAPDEKDKNTMSEVEEATRDALVLWFLSLFATVETAAVVTIPTAMPEALAAGGAPVPSVAVTAPPPMAVGVTWSVPPAKIVDLDKILKVGQDAAIRVSIETEAKKTGLKPISPAKPIQIADSRRRTMLEKITNTTNNDLRQVIIDGVKDGKTVQEIAEELKASGYSKQRAEVIAETEVAYASEAAAKEFGEQHGFKWKSWYLGPAPCEVCIEIKKKVTEAGGSIPIAQPFHGGIEIPPVHPHCKCTVVYHNRPPSGGTNVTN